MTRRRSIPAREAGRADDDKPATLSAKAGQYERHHVEAATRPVARAGRHAIACRTIPVMGLWGIQMSGPNRVRDGLIN